MMKISTSKLGQSLPNGPLSSAIICSCQNSVFDSKKTRFVSNKIPHNIQLSVQYNWTILWLRIEPPDPESQLQVPPVSGHFSPFLCFPTLPLSLLKSTLVKVFNRILQRGCKAVGPEGPDSISLWLFQALVSHFNSGKQNFKKNYH